MANSMSEIFSSSLKSLKDIVDVNTVIGEPLKISENLTIIPVTKVTFGYGGGGGSYPKKETKDETFGGGTGAGATVEPLAFLIVKDDDVRLLQLAEVSSAADRVVTMVPEVIDKISAMTTEKKSKKVNPNKK